VELQPEQGLPPTGDDVPDLSLEKQANFDRAGIALVWQPGQGAPSPAWLIGRNSSNLVRHLGQINSYIGIFTLKAILTPAKTDVNEPIQTVSLPRE
jgi:hypothetical protein